MDLYRLIDSANRLLYIGISISAIQRASQHRAEKQWWNEVAKIEITNLGDVSRDEALRVEKAAIIAESPIYNIVGNRSNASLPNSASDDYYVADASQEPPVGWFFLTPDPDHGFPLAQNQGQVIRQVGPEHFFVRHFSWWSGDEFCSFMVPIADTLQWRFYANNAEFIKQADKVSSARTRLLDQQSPNKYQTKKDVA